jgi:hypothetical protein
VLGDILGPRESAEGQLARSVEVAAVRGGTMPFLFGHAVAPFLVLGSLATSRSSAESKVGVSG